MTSTAEHLELLSGPSGDLQGGVLRSVKMLRPICDICTKPPVKAGWWERCTHGPHGDPYFTFSRVQTQSFEVEKDEQGNITSAEPKIKQSYVAMPNFTQIPLSERVGNSNGDVTLVDRKRREGFILPEEHKLATADPKNYLNEHYCEYHNCWSRGKVVTQFQNGRYCREVEAKMIRLMEEEGTCVEVFNGRIQRKQLAGVVVR